MPPRGLTMRWAPFNKRQVLDQQAGMDGW